MKACKPDFPFGNHKNHKIQGYLTPGSFILLWVLSLLVVMDWLPITPQPVVAQPAGFIISDPPIQSDFPELAIEFKVYDENKQPVQQLNREQLTILEDDKQITVDEVKRVQGQVHFILAINADPILAVRDANGISNYEYLISAINNWQHPTNLRESDSWSFLVNQGRNVTRLNNVDAWHALVKDYQPDFRAAEKGLNSLKASIELARTIPDKIRHDQVVLYITPAPTVEDLDVLGSLTREALDAGVHVNIWMVGNENDASSPRGQALYGLSQATGGSFTLFQASRAVPNPQSYLEPFGIYFKASYRSQVITSGSHTSAISWKTRAQEITSAINEFEMEVLAPVPVFLSPPINVERQLTASFDGSATQQPDLQEIRVLIDFPDGHPRGIKFLQLYQDGSLVSEVTSPPFVSLNWDVGQVSTSRLVYLQLSLEDELGLQASSVVLPVNVSVQAPTPAEADRLSPGQVAMIIGAGTILILLGVLAWQLRRRATTRQSVGRLEVAPRPKDTPKSLAANACLIRLDKQLTSINEPAIPISRITTTFGSDPNLVNICINHPSLNPVHARIQSDGRQVYRIADLGSIAGTWLNFAPVSRQGALLQNLDIIHFGKVAFRFSIGYTSLYERDHSQGQV